MKTESMPIVRKANVVCAGNTSQCSAKNTCCQTATGLSLIGLHSCVRRRCVHRLVWMLPAPQGHVLL